MRPHAVAASLVLLLAAVLLSATLPRAAAIHEDQLGRFDWHRQYLGRYRAVEFAKKSARVAVASQLNALAALNLRTGDVEWRQVFGEREALREMVMTEKPAALFTLSGLGQAQVLRAWNLHSGALVWDRQLCDEVDAEGTEPSVQGGLLQLGPEQSTALSRSLVFVTACGQLQAINSSTADIEWASPLPRGAHVVRVSLQPLSTSITAVSVLASRVEAITMSAMDGSQLSAVSLEVPAEAGVLSAASLTVMKSTVVILSADGSQLCTAALEGDTSVTCMPTSKALPSTENAAVVTLAGTQPKSALLAASGEGSTMAFTLGALRADESGAIVKELATVKGYSAACVLSLDRGGEVVGFVGGDAAGVKWRVVDGATGKELHSEVVNNYHNWGREMAGGGTTGVDSCYLATFTKKDGSAGWRMLVVASDSASVLLQQSEAVWVREEALARVISSLALDFPKSGNVDGGNMGLSWVQRLRKQILTLKVQLGVAVVEEAAELNELRIAGSDKMLSTPDSSGFRKLLLVLSAEGKLLALHNGDGHVVWSLSYNKDSAPQILRMWQEPHSLKVSPKVMLLNVGGLEGVCSIVDAHTGKQVEADALPSPAVQVVTLPQTVRIDSAEQRMFLAVSQPIPSGRFTAKLLPSTPATRDAFRPHAASTIFWTVEDAPVPALRGFALEKGVDDDGAYSTVEIWSLLFGGGESILAVEQRRGGNVHSRVKILGDRSMLVKYLNRNTLFLATGDSADAPVNEGSELTIHILDSVTGRHLFRHVHQGSCGPVSVAMAENWAVYHYWSTINLRFEMAVIELYDDSSIRSLSLADAVMANSSALVSSYDATAIKTLRQVFFLNMGVKGMTVTDTARGITGKQILMATTTDQVYALDKRFLDPRRPLGTPTSIEKEERLMPYKADLGVSPMFYATYDKVVAGLHGIDTFPTTLESTSLMFAYGMDLFYTRLAPSKNFDMLDDDFSYALLVVTLLAMASLGVYLQVTKSRNELAKKWV